MSEGSTAEEGFAPPDDEADVPAGYTARGGDDRCEDCVFYGARPEGPGGPHKGDCLVHGPPPYRVDPEGWCPEWQSKEDPVPML